MFMLLCVSNFGRRFTSSVALDLSNIDMSWMGSWKEESSFILIISTRFVTANMNYRYSQSS